MFKSPQQRSAYFEMLKNSGKLNQGVKASPLGVPPQQHMNQIAASPMAPPAMPPHSVQPIGMQPAIKANVPPNPMQPLNPAGANKFGRVKKFF